MKALKIFFWVRDLAGAWIFYTILPKLPIFKTSFNRIVRFAPLIGFFIGLFQSILWFILSQLNWSTESKTLVVISIGYLVTGGLHLDGLIDTADGLSAGKEKCLEAMRDSRVGAMGVQALLLVLLLQISSILRLGDLSFFLFPIVCFWGRFSQLIAIEKFSYLHPKGLGALHKSNWKGLKSEMIPSILFILSLTFILIINPFKTYNYIKLLISAWLGIVPAIFIPYFLGKKLGGHTGDSYGASVVLTEIAIFILLSLIL